MLRVSEDWGRRWAAQAAGYGDLGRALLDLQAAADQVFDTVSKRTAEEREKLSAISMRIKAAKAKIKALSQSEEPLAIVSPARHPSSSTKQRGLQTTLSRQTWFAYSNHCCQWRIQPYMIILPLPKLQISFPKPKMAHIWRIFYRQQTIQLWETIWHLTPRVMNCHLHHRVYYQNTLQGLNLSTLTACLHLFFNSSCHAHA